MPPFPFMSPRLNKFESIILHGNLTPGLYATIRLRLFVHIERLPRFEEVVWRGPKQRGGIFRMHFRIKPRAGQNCEWSVTSGSTPNFRYGRHFDLHFPFRRKWA